MCSAPPVPYSLEIVNNDISELIILIILSEEEIAFPIDTDNSIDIWTIFYTKDPEIRDI